MIQAIDALFVRFRSIPFFWRMVLFLCAWDYHRLRGLVTERPWQATAVPSPRLDWLGFCVFGVSLIAVFGVTRSLASTAWVRGFMITGLLAGLVTLVRFVTVGRRLRG